MTQSWRTRVTAEDGGVSILTAFAIPALIGVMALGTETAFWYVKSHTLQNAADSAVIAATMAAAGGHVAEAKAVARRYGLVDGIDNVAVTAVDNAPCPAGGNNCYRVTIAAKVPLLLSPIVGFLGTTTVDGRPATQLTGDATARRGGSTRNYCLVALAGNGVSPAISASGSPKADLSGCGIGSNTAMRCNGHDLKADFGNAVGTNDGCGVQRQSGIAGKIVDPYAARISGLPADSCNGVFPKIGKLPPSNIWNGARTLGSTTVICGDLQLVGNVTVTAPADAVLVIRNGYLNTNGRTLQTASGSSLGIVFTGTNDPSHGHSPQGSGRLDITAPTTGHWAGVALYQDKSLTSNIAVSAAAKDPEWAITGLIYFPNIELEFKGSVGKSTFGQSCVTVVANNIVIKGTGLALSQAGCTIAGLKPIDDGATGRGSLVS